MNRERRASIATLITQLEDLAETIAVLQESAETIRDEELDSLENMPDSLRNSERGQASEEALGHLEDAVSALEDFDIDSITSSLESASE